MRKIILVALALLLALFVYHVLSDRYTPYTSQARVDAFLTQVAPEVAGDVLQVYVSDNSAVRKGQLLFRIDPEPYQVALRSAEANLSVALQGADVSVADVAAAQAKLRKQRVDLAANQQLGRDVTGLVDQKALAETQGIRARADVAKTEADVKALKRISRRRAPTGARRDCQSEGQAGACRTRSSTARRAQYRGARAFRRDRHEFATCRRPICSPRAAAAELSRKWPTLDLCDLARISSET